MAWVSLNNLTRFYTKLKEKFYLKTEVDTKLGGKAASSHTHDDRYYTESEINSKLNGKANSSHTHDDRYYTESETNTLLNSKVNTSDIIDNLTSTNTDKPLSANQGKVLNDNFKNYYNKTEVDDLLDNIDSSVTGSQVLPIFNNAGFKNSIFRGQYLGTSITTAQYNAISNGTFEDLYLGDYWTIGGHNWRIWGFNTFLGTGDTKCTSPHILLMPDDNYLKRNGNTLYMKDTADTSGGYKATKFFTTYANQIYHELTPYFGSHILSHRELISNATSNGLASGFGWASITVGIPTEINIYGASIWGGSTIAVGGAGYNIGVNKTAFPLAIVNPSFITNSEAYWLRDIVSASSFAYVESSGNALYYFATVPAIGVRPYILIS